MAQFVAGKPIRTTQPYVVVDRGLPAGEHRFQLQVVDEAGNWSLPATLVVTIVVVHR